MFPNYICDPPAVTNKIASHIAATYRDAGTMVLISQSKEALPRSVHPIIRQPRQALLDNSSTLLDKRDTRHADRNEWADRHSQRQGKPLLLIFLVAECLRRNGNGVAVNAVRYHLRGNVPADKASQTRVPAPLHICLDSVILLDY